MPWGILCEHSLHIDTQMDPVFESHRGLQNANPVNNAKFPASGRGPTAAVGIFKGAAAERQEEPVCEHLPCRFQG
ncbi:hypothetical protein AGR4C_pb30026 [Agrobacterium tumefaciens str. Kerr 14]|uniref:Uncharacterized protein n=1 Tax=Agrobacterium tumefaciens str. Kerr 14 TaxID=1183424 RepID=A0A1S7SEK9_AGRTU|nr:hypothetical protein AGR4C_pb30026 [Agrobacterium tumefaciens str. Kerr 14]